MACACVRIVRVLAMVIANPTYDTKSGSEEEGAYANLDASHYHAPYVPQGEDGEEGDDEGGDGIDSDGYLAVEGASATDEEA